MRSYDSSNSVEPLYIANKHRKEVTVYTVLASSLFNCLLHLHKIIKDSAGSIKFIVTWQLDIGFSKNNTLL